MGAISPVVEKELKPTNEILGAVKALKSMSGTIFQLNPTIPTEVISLFKKSH